MQYIFSTKVTKVTKKVLVVLTTFCAFFLFFSLYEKTPVSFTMSSDDGVKVTKESTNPADE